MQMPPSIATAIVRVCRDVRQLGADDRNKHGGYNFVSVDKFYAAIGPIMAGYGLATIANIARSEIVESRNDDGKTKSHLYTEWELYLVHDDGSIFGPLRRDVTVVASGPQAYASAESFVTKYFLRSTFKIPTGDKDDADLHDQAPLPPRDSAQTVKRPSPVDERVLEFVQQVNDFLNKPGVGISEFVQYCNDDKTIDDRMNKISSGIFDHLDPVRALKYRISALEGAS